jgi:hypothetical protein
MVTMLTPKEISMPMVLMRYGGSGEPKLNALPDGDMLAVAKAFAEAQEAKQTIKIYSVDNSGVEQRYPEPPPTPEPTPAPTPAPNPEEPTPAPEPDSEAGARRRHP